MKKMKPGSFFGYMAPAVIVGLISWFFVVPAVSAGISRPEHRAYEKAAAEHAIAQEKYQKRLEEAKAKQQLRDFELVLAGRAEPKTLEDPQHRAVAEALLKLKQNDTTEQMSGINRLLLNEKGDADLLTRFVDCKSFGMSQDGRQVARECRFTGVLTVLENNRLVALWSDDPAVVDKTLTAVAFPEQPAALAPPPTTPQYLMNGYLAWVILWFAFSLPTASAFFLTGLLARSIHYSDSGLKNLKIRYRDPDDEDVKEEIRRHEQENSQRDKPIAINVHDLCHRNATPAEIEARRLPNPFTAAPGFLFGWLVLLTLLPGYLFIQLLHLMLHLTMRDFDQIRSFLSPKKFDNEYERAAAHLERLKDSDLLQRHPELTARIEKSRVRIEQTKDAAELTRIRAQLEGIEEYARSLEDIDQMLRNST